MAAQSLPSGSCSNSPLNPSQNPKTPCFTGLPFSPKRLSLKTHNSFISEIVLSNKKFKCRSSTERVEISGSDDTGGLEKGIRRKNLAVFVSGGGSNFRAVHEAILGGSIHGDIVLLVTNKHGCGGADYPRNKGIPVILYPGTKPEAEGLSSDDLVATLRRYKVDFVLLAGYLKLLPPVLVRAYPKSILNIHPSLLPAFGGKGYYGLKVHKAVIASGARYSGPTIHFVDENYDTGRTLAQRIVSVLANDMGEDLAARVLHQEHKMYVEVVEALCEERIKWREDGVPLIQSNFGVRTWPRIKCSHSSCVI